MGSAHAAGFDCSKARLPMEKAICADQALSQADSELNDSYVFLRTYCGNIAARADLRATQRRWLVATRKGFGKSSRESRDRLRTAYSSRNAVLAELVAECTPVQKPIHLKVTWVRVAGQKYVMPFVQTEPPLPGWRINKVVFGTLYDAPPPLDLSKLQDYFASHAPNHELTSHMPPDFQVVGFKVNLLVAVSFGETCMLGDITKCQPFEDNYNFDLRTGRLVQTDEIITQAGMKSLAEMMRKKLLGLAREIIANRQSEEAREYAAQSRKCVENWANNPDVIPEHHIFGDGVMSFVLPTCTLTDENGEKIDPVIDKQFLKLTFDELRPYLSTYGKSLLLGDGVVREPDVHQ